MIEKCADLRENSKTSEIQKKIFFRDSLFFLWTLHVLRNIILCNDALIFSSQWLLIGTIESVGNQGLSSKEVEKIHKVGVVRPHINA